MSACEGLIAICIVGADDDEDAVPEPQPVRPGIHTGGGLDPHTVS